MVTLLAVLLSLPAAHAEVAVTAPVATAAAPVAPEMYDRLEPGTTDDEAAIHSAQSAPTPVEIPAEEKAAPRRATQGL